MANGNNHRDAPQATMAYLAQRKSEKGRTYFVGWAGHCRLLMFKTTNLDKFDNPVWRLIVQEGEVKPGTFHKAPDAADSPSTQLEQQALPGSAPKPSPKPRPERVDHSKGLDDEIPF